MTRYFFDIHDHEKIQSDEEGVELPDIEAVRIEAMRALPAIAYDEIPRDGDRQNFIVVARDEHGPIYTATLSFVGLKLRR